jgi:hypothetical protein
MASRFRSRNWHNWAAPLVAVPLLLVALTAVLLAHRKAIGAAELTVAANWLPGYGAPARVPRLEPRTLLTLADGDVYLGTGGGLYRLRGEGLEAVSALAGNPVRGLVEAPWGRIAATRNGVWLEQQGRWQQVLPGEAWSAATAADGRVLVALRERGVLASSDGRRWQLEARLAIALAAAATVGLADPAEPLTLARLAMDLHSGRAWFGREREWIWIDVLAAALALLASTGLWMWGWRRWRRPARLAPAQAVT